MISGLLIYAVFRKRADPRPPHPQAANKDASIVKIAAVAATMFLAAAMPARAADTVTRRRHRAFPGRACRHRPNSPLTPLTKDPAWQRHAKFFDTAFGQLEQRQLSKIRTWADANLAAPRPTMFYMFSGPDFLYANAFYRKATTYVLSALEPVGSVPDLTRLPRGGIGAALYDVERSMGSILSFSFFITKQMKTDLHAGQLSGTLPILYVFLARSGKTIRDVSLVALDDKGAVFANENRRQECHAGRRIVFAGSDGVEKTLYYFSTDLSNSGVKSQRLPEILRNAGARQQPDQERVLSAAFRQFHHRARFPARQQRHHHPGRFRHSAGLLQSEEMAVLPVRPLCRSDRRIPGTISGSNMPSCSGAASRWISASAIAGARMNRTCCCRSGCLGRAPANAEADGPLTEPPAANRRAPEKPRPPPTCRGAQGLLSGFRASVQRASIRTAYHRTLWLGTMKAVVLGALGAVAEIICRRRR